MNREKNKYIVYLLTNTNNNYTYLGITNNSIRRLRQHNGEIKGVRNIQIHLRVMENGYII